VVATLADGSQIEARRVVLALPPRVLAQRVSFAPGLPEGAQRAMTGIPTWMAGQAKAVAVYDRAFWREAGLSGDAMSRAGPMVEVHDASPMSGGPFALFGFIGVPPRARLDAAGLRAAVLQQFARLFGPQAANPKQFYLKDWALDAETAVVRDGEPLSQHPAYGLPAAMAGLWEERLLFGSTEVAPQFGGFLEGALEAAERAFAKLAARVGP
jgi:monoamine oxidase